MKLCSTLTLLATAALLAAPAAGRAQTLSNLGAKNASQASPYQGTVVEDIVARINDRVISESDLNRAAADMDAQAREHNWTEAQTDAAKKDLLRDLIDQQLLLSRGKEMDITGDAETVRQLDELRKQNHLDSMEDLQKAAEAQGVSFEDFKASIRNRIITSQVIREEVGRRINLTQSEEQAYYDAHKSEFDRPEQVRLSEILIPTPNPDDAAQVSQAEAKAADVEAQLKGGKDFAALAKAQSGGPTAADGGVIGDFKRGQLAKVLEDATFNLKAGEYTAPMRTKQGVIILKVDAHQPGGIAPFADVEGQIQDQLGMSKMEPALRAYLTRLREEAWISVKPGYVDSAASPNEQKIVFSAYQPPQPKKKKKLQRTRYTGRGRTTHTKAAQTEQAANTTPAAPAGVPSLADVPQGSNAAASTANAAASTANAASSSSSTKQVATTATQKPGKREKVRYGQAPRETLPSSNSTTSVDAGASAANGNGSVNEQSAAATQQMARADQPPPTPGSAPSGARYTTGESADEPQPTDAPEKKTRFSDRAKLPKSAKNKNKNAPDPLTPPPATPDEVATRQEQSAPLGLAGDTSKKPPKPKATGGKTRYSDEAKSKSNDNDQLTTPAATDTPGASNANPPATFNTPPSPAGPSANPMQPAPNGNPAPVRTQDTPNGTGDPLGPAVPTPAQPQSSQPQ